LDWIEQFYVPANTVYRLYGRRFLEVKRPNNSIKVLKKKATKETQRKQKTKYTYKYEIVHAKEIQI